jgi:1-aminocyclopropane-1-carboxylate deaminase
MEVLQQINNNLPSPLEACDISPFITSEKIIHIKRDDLIHPLVSGNKWRKLKAWMTKAKDFDGIASCGGAYSNHLIALACLCEESKIPLKAFIRGDELHSQSNQYLAFLHGKGVELSFVSRQAYRELRENPIQLHNQLWIPEGGMGSPAMEGLFELCMELPKELDYFFVACGTGTTMAGLIKGFKQLNRKTRVIGVACLPAKGWLESQVEQLSGASRQEFEIDHRFGKLRFAQHTPELTSFCEAFKRETHISIEPVYTGKLFSALVQQINEKEIPSKAEIGVLHCGGIFQDSLLA